MDTDLLHWHSPISLHICRIASFNVLLLHAEILKVSVLVGRRDPPRA